MPVSAMINWDEFVSDGADWTRRTAPMVLSILLERLKNKDAPISYGELAKQLSLRFGEPEQLNKQKYGHPLGAAARAAIATGRAHGMIIPPLTVIVIREDVGYAGTGVDFFVKRLRGRDLELKDPRRKAILDDEVKRVLAFDATQWERLEQLLGLAPLPRPRTKVKDFGTPPKVKRHGGGEKPAHAALKHWVAAHPEKFREFGHYTVGDTEVLLESGDSIDAMLLGETTRLAVEVKASNATQKELIRGIFQCVKYRHTMWAEASVYPKDFLPGTCVLVSTKALSQRVRSIAEFLEVPFRQLPLSCEKGR